LGALSDVGGVNAARLIEHVVDFFFGVANALREFAGAGNFLKHVTHEVADVRIRPIRNEAGRTDALYATHLRHHRRSEQVAPEVPDVIAKDARLRDDGAGEVCPVDHGEICPLPGKGRHQVSGIADQRYARCARPVMSLRQQPDRSRQQLTVAVGQRVVKIVMPAVKMPVQHVA